MRRAGGSQAGKPDGPIPVCLPKLLENPCLASPLFTLFPVPEILSSPVGSPWRPAVAGKLFWLGLANALVFSSAS